MHQLKHFDQADVHFSNVTLHSGHNLPRAFRWRQLAIAATGGQLRIDYWRKRLEYMDRGSG